MWIAIVVLIIVCVVPVMTIRGDSRLRPEARVEALAAASAPGSAPLEARFAATGDHFELVGALEGRRLMLWLDGFADNAPVVGASLELEIGDTKLVARAVGDRYEVELPAPPTTGSLPVTVTVTAGNDLDLLAADLVVAARPEGAR
jgi:hypothetical protein